jgi:hypothetical protein
MQIRPILIGQKQRSMCSSAVEGSIIRIYIIQVDISYDEYQAAIIKELADLIHNLYGMFGYDFLPVITA